MKFFSSMEHVPRIFTQSFSSDARLNYLKMGFSEGGFTLPKTLQRSINTLLMMIGLKKREILLNYIKGFTKSACILKMLDMLLSVVFCWEATSQRQTVAIG